MADVLSVGTVLQERYRIDGVLGTGGQGGVYLAHHLLLEFDLAIKEISLANVSEELRPAVVKRFREEARILHRLEHRCLPRVHDFFEYEGQPYLAMERVVGQSLDKIVLERKFTEAELLAIARQLCDVLLYLHSQTPAVIFRDLKPANIMLTPDETIKIIDFGIAKRIEVDGPEQTGTMARGVGSRGFAPLEQYAGGTDARTDIYALGATLFNLATQQVPPEAAEIAAGSVELPRVRKLRPDITGRFSSAVWEMMKQKRENRPPTIRHVESLLWDSEAAADTPSTSKTPSPSAATGAGAPPQPPTQPVGVPFHQLPTESLGASPLNLPPEFAAAPLPGPPSPPWYNTGAGRGVVLALVGALAILLLIQFNKRERETPRAGPSPTVASAEQTVVAVPTNRRRTRQAPMDPATVVVATPAPTASTAPTVDERPPATLTVTSSPAGATVLVDDKERGHTPATVDQLHKGSIVVVKLQLAGYEPRIKAVELADSENSVNIDLKGRPYRLTMTLDPPSTSVIVDGAARPPASTILELPAGHHELEFRQDGYLSQKRSVDAVDGGSTSWQIALERQTVTVKLVGLPGVDVTVDGKSWGATAVRQARLPVGRYKIEANIPLQKRSASIEVTGQASEEVRLDDVLFLERSLKAQAPADGSVLIIQCDPPDRRFSRGPVLQVTPNEAAFLCEMKEKPLLTIGFGAEMPGHRLFAVTFRSSPSAALRANTSYPQANIGDYPEFALLGSSIPPIHDVGSFTINALEYKSGKVSRLEATFAMFVQRRPVHAYYGYLRYVSK